MYVFVTILNNKIPAGKSKIMQGDIGKIKEPP